MSKEEVLKEKEELGKLTQLLINQTQAIGQYEMGNRKRIQDCISKSANTALQNIEEIVTERNDRSLKQIITKITETCEGMNSMIEIFRAEKK